MARKAAPVTGDLVPLFATRELWGLVLFNALEDEEAGVSALRSFGKVASRAAAAQYLTATWRFPGGWKWRATISAGVHHVLIGPDRKEYAVGRDDPHPVLPILRWQELAQMDRANGDPALVLMLALATQAQTKPEAAAATARYVEALNATCKLGRAAPKIAGLLVEQSTTWMADKRLGWVSTSANSARNPTGHFGKLYAKSKMPQALRAFFAALDD